ncbi:MAG TPA: substrate-binding domain-containing protein [Thermoanaerobaculia bacterium]|nr:substrate-binding domain-containing protein [Thermoanaerobaculia bacterium]
MFLIASAAAAADLRVCADPNNLPFSNRVQQGFENALAQLVAHDLGRTVKYYWWPQRRGFVRNTLNAGKCDVVMGVPSNYELTLTTQPYYRSTYVFITRHDRHLNIHSFNDSILKRLRIGVHEPGNDYANVPPAQALINRGLANNIVGYVLTGDYSKPNPPANLIDAVARGDIDVAIAWGPLGGYFSKREPVRLDVVPVSPQIDLPFLPFVFDISMGVRRGNQPMRDALDSVLQRRQSDIRALLARYGVPLVDGGS